MAVLTIPSPVAGFQVTRGLFVLCLQMILLIVSLVGNNVSGAPAATIIAKQKYPAEVRYGESVHLQCKFDPSEKQFLRWEGSNGLPIDTRRQTNYKITDDYKLQIRNTTLVEAGQYHCVVRPLKSPHVEQRIAAEKLALSVEGLENIGDGNDPMLKEGKSAAVAIRSDALAIMISVLLLVISNFCTMTPRR